MSPDRARTDGLDRAAENSAVVAVLQRASGSATTLTDWLGHVTRQSFLYRWLTREPDPEVVVIDLRETYTVGPAIALLDRIASSHAWNTLVRTRESSVLYRVGERVVGVVETRAGRAVAALLEPPEPPDEHRRP